VQGLGCGQHALAFVKNSVQILRIGEPLAHVARQVCGIGPQQGMQGRPLFGVVDCKPLSLGRSPVGDFLLLSQGKKGLPGGLADGLMARIESQPCC
jgi:hypothetical protein